MPELKVKHWAGSVTSNSMGEHPGEWFNVWYQAAVKAEAAGNRLVVFQIPEARKVDLIEKIEILLQNEIPKV